jgi:hypothetical protein
MISRVLPSKVTMMWSGTGGVERDDSEGDVGAVWNAGEGERDDGEGVVCEASMFFVFDFFS